MLRETESKIAARGAGDPEAMYKIAEAYAMLGDRTSALRALQGEHRGRVLFLSLSDDRSALGEACVERVNFSDC